MIAEPKPTPGGGSVSAYAGALGAALARMVLSLAVRKR
ncbi:MAG: cyclodeaminase/cyclohydrolase family protein, partial [Planctomycetes bacterium]|nr:cyclodeaminase/cyclohydrolase family protein [Planctomycetota bacterium]